MQKTVLIDVFHRLFPGITVKGPKAFTAAHMGVLCKISDGNIVGKVLLYVGNHFLNRIAMVMGRTFYDKGMIFLSDIAQSVDPKLADQAKALKLITVICLLKLSLIHI